MILIIWIIILAALCTFAYAALRGAPWAPTKKHDVRRFLKLANIQRGQKVYDLGVGDGRLVCAAADAGAIAQGFEISIIPYIVASIRRLFQKDKNKIKISYKDIWGADLSDADVVYFFLLPKHYPKLKEKLERELRQDAKVIAYVWPIEGWKPVVADKEKGYANLFLYRMKRVN